jgi:hypothetical protein
MEGYTYRAPRSLALNKGTHRLLLPLSLVFFGGEKGFRRVRGGGDGASVGELK